MARLTDRQIAEVYFHPTARDGSLLEPDGDPEGGDEEETMTPEQAKALTLAIVEALGGGRERTGYYMERESG